MDYQLRCNHLRCRERLRDKAIVTTCSHIFCLACSDSALGSGESTNRTCPACGTTLDKPYDKTVAILRPTDDYKMSVLSGLSPTIIMECANSGMAFWAYQSSQEIYYQEHANKSLKQQLDVKNQELSGVRSSAREEIGKLEDSIQNASEQINRLNRSLAELEEGRKSLERDRNKYRSSYEKLKQKALVPDIETAAEENAAFAAQGGDYGGAYQPQSRAGSNGSGGRRLANEYFRTSNSNQHSGLQSARGANAQISSSHHRQPPRSAYGNHASHFAPGYVPNSNNHPGTPFRQPLGNIDQNSYGAGGGGFGTSGVKIGRQPSGFMSRSGMNSSRPMGGMGFR
ncbi:hypothetical protein Q7P37_007110 [Cladosporium fusiforme]